MSRLRVAVIVEGDGEVQAIRILLSRIWLELIGGEYVDIASPPIRVSRSKLIPHGKGQLNKTELEKAVTMASSKLRNPMFADPSMVLILLDSDLECPRDLAPLLLHAAQQNHRNVEIACVLAHKEYETWFVACADSLRDVLEFDEAPENPEVARSGKAWIERHFRGAKYSETIDQPSMTQKMDLVLCRARSPSFDKLCRELEIRKTPTSTSAPTP